MSFFVCYCSLILLYIIYILGYWPCATRPSAHISIFTISLFCHVHHFCAVKPNNNNNNNNMAVGNNLTWATQSKSLLDRLGFSEAWIEPELMNLTTFMCEVKERLTDQYTQSWRQMLRESTGKLRTYRTFKHDFRMEAYLNLPVYLRIPVTKFRVSAHPLRIETGRYALPQPIPPGERYCWFCQNTVEDEVHFLLKCSCI